MPNIIAYLALYAWPVVAIILFRILPLQRALVWTILGGYLLLPSATGVKFPMLPTIDKTLVTSVPALILCLIMAPRATASPEPMARTGRNVLYILLAMVLVSPILTVLQNTEPVIEGNSFLPGLRLYDAYGLISQTVVSLIPMWLGFRYLNDREGHRAILEGLALGGLAYTIPVLFEVRFSPQLHTWIYGFFPHNFAQHIRNGGFRPVVFLTHGLFVGIYLCIAVIAATSLYRAARREGRGAFKWLLATLWLLAVLSVSKNLGALMIALCLAAAAFLLGRRPQILLALVVAAVVMVFPILRGAGWIPVDAAYRFVQTIDVERANSFKFRLDNEDALLARANEKPLAGWGSWGRNLLHDPETGELSSTSDGIWVAFIGMYGWIGYLGRFGLLTAPILFYAIRRKAAGPSMVPIGLIMALCAALIDLLPNSALVNYVWLMAGAIAGSVLWRSSSDETAPAGAAGSLLPTRRAAWLMPDVGPLGAKPQGPPATGRSRR